MTTARTLPHVPPKSPEDWAALQARAAELFTPSAPIDHVDLFAGRWEKLTAIRDAVVTKGQHAIVFGERGVGKTSLVSVVGALLKVLKVSVAIVVRENCGKADTYAKVWKRALGQVVLTIERNRIGFDAGTTKEIRSLAKDLTANPGPDEVVALLRAIDPYLLDRAERRLDLAEKSSK